MQDRAVTLQDIRANDSSDKAALTLAGIKI
jgi:hypothetical protein